MAMRSTEVALRPPTEEDAPALLPLWRDREALRFTYQPHLADVPACVEHLRWLALHARAGEGRSWAVLVAGRVVGIGGVERRAERTREIWYALRRDAWGAGIGTTVVSRLVDLAFEDDSTDRITAEVVIENEPSVRVLVKNGFRWERTTPGGFVRDGVTRDLAVYVVAR